MKRFVLGWRGAAAALLLAAGLLALLDRLFPPPLPAATAPQALVVLARDGTPLRAFADTEQVWRQPVTPAEVSPYYLEALLAYEDRRYYLHPGVDPLALLRAAGQWAIHGRWVSGGSTLTMQVARLLEPIPHSAGGKLWQMARALQLELHCSKEEILTLYLNHAPMGGVLEGVEAASRGYLGKPARRLTRAEAALLAVIPQAPSRLRPDRYPQAARAARDKVLRRMAEHWPAAEIDDALTEPLYALALREPLLAPLLAERLRQQAGGRARIDTTLDVAMQTAVERLLADRSGSLPPRVSLAALVLDNATLEVRAYAGSADFTDATRFAHVDMVRAARSPGSTLKPFLYGLALDEGLIHSESLLADAPQSFAGYQPGNFQQSFHGPVSVSEALVKSLNVPAVEVLEQLDPARFVALLRRGGLKLEFPRDAAPNLSVILGGAGTTLEQLVGAYAALARDGLSGRPRYTPQDPFEEARMLSPGAAFIVRDILEAGGPLGRATGELPGAQRGIAWKTGTSFGFRDAWAIGVSDRVTIGVWVGRPDGTPNPGYFGANAAAPLLLDLFAAVDPAPPAPRAPPAEVTQEAICWPLGTRAAATPPALCHVRRTAWVLNGVAPPSFADRLRGGEPRYAYWVQPASGRRVSAECGGGGAQRVEAVRWPAVLEPWLDAGLRTRALPPPWATDCAQRAAPEAGLHIAGLASGAVLQAAREPAAPQVQLEVRGQRGAVHWLVNGRPVGRSAAGEPLLQRFDAPGRYEITAVDEQGRYDRVAVSVR
jgi:penicillin-binding protein 1C